MHHFELSWHCAFCLLLEIFGNLLHKSLLDGQKVSPFYLAKFLLRQTLQKTILMCLKACHKLKSAQKHETAINAQQFIWDREDTRTVHTGPE